ncbi:MAG: hypothetical protein ACKPKO_32625, partial [Candidatus Fonsibacter sp.]
ASTKKGGKYPDGCAWTRGNCQCPHDNYAKLACRQCRRPMVPVAEPKEQEVAPHGLPVPMDSSGDLGENVGSLALQEREATTSQVVGMIQLFGVTSPLKTLKAAGLTGVSLNGDKAKDAPEMRHNERPLGKGHGTAQSVWRISSVW